MFEFEHLFIAWGTSVFEKLCKSKVSVLIGNMLNRSITTSRVDLY